MDVSPGHEKMSCLISDRPEENQLFRTMGATHGFVISFAEPVPAMGHEALAHLAPNPSMKNTELTFG